MTAAKTAGRSTRAAEGPTAAFEHVTTASREAFRDNVDRSLAAMSEMGAFSKQNIEAVIASALAAQLYGAAVLQTGLEDDPENYTRFVLVAREAAVLRGPSKVSLTFTLPNQPGALHRALGAFATRGLNLSKIESCPLHGRPWEYVFYLDVAGDPPAQVREALAELEGLTKELRVLGWYPAAAA